MTRKEADCIIYKVINSGIISEELENDLSEVAQAICDNSFEKCKATAETGCCDECRFIEG